MDRKQFFLITLFILVLLLWVDPLYAGPGGAIAKAFFKTWWGKAILIALTVIFLPLVIYVRLREYIEIRRTKKQLAEIANTNKDFSWLSLDKTVRNIFSRVYIAWNNENMKEASEYVSSWYWQNQQLVVLDEWKRENLRNICKVDKVKKVSPLYLEISDEQTLEGSRIAFRIDAVIKDYLINRDTFKVVKGKNTFDEEEKIWILEYTDGRWLLDDIQDADLSLAFAKTKNIIPETLKVQKIPARSN
ncbi:hypothetical protein [Flagellimonas sp.]|uniref:hypothetical protein n=1 Tax=Flagellimonas sp. TaxID=2058762 RepID=UPI003B52196B